jgi:two-component system LytT family response regulator
MESGGNVNADTQFVDDQTVSHLVERISTAVRDSMVSAAPRRIVAERDGRLYFLAQADIDCIEANRNYVTIQAGDETYTLRWTMGGAEAALEPGSFLRVHRSTIVNLHKIRQMQRGLHGQYAITLANGRCFTSGRAYRQQIQAHLRNGK